MDVSELHTSLFVVIFVYITVIQGFKGDQCASACGDWEIIGDLIVSRPESLSASQVNLSILCQCGGNLIRNKSTIGTLKNDNKINESDDILLDKTLCSDNTTTKNTHGRHCIIRNGTINYFKVEVVKVICVKAETSPPNITTFELSWEGGQIDLLRSPETNIDYKKQKGVKVKCSASGSEPSCVRLMIDGHQVGEGSSLVITNSSLKEVNTLTCEVYINNFKKSSVSTSINGTDCFVPCPRMNREKQLWAEEGEPLTVTFCVSAELLQPEAFLNGTRTIRGQQKIFDDKTNITWDFETLYKGTPVLPCYNVTFTVAQITHEMAGLFTVVLMNRYRPDILCNTAYMFNITVTDKATTPSTKVTSTAGVTKSLQPHIPHSAASLTTILITLVSFILFFFVITLMLVCFFCRHKEILLKTCRPRTAGPRQSMYEMQCDRHSEEAERAPCLTVTHVDGSLLNGEQRPHLWCSQETGRYISPEGLTYVIPIHTFNTSRRVGFAHKPRDHVEYATLDMQHTGKYNLDDKDGRKKLKQLEKHFRFKP